MVPAMITHTPPTKNPVAQTSTTPRTPADARMSVVRFAAHLGDVADAAALCASEMVTNALIHAQCPDPAMVLRLYADRLAIEVTDTDPTQRVRIAPPPTDPVEVFDLGEGGRGMGLVHTLSRGACGTVYDDRTKTVWCHIPIEDDQ